MMPGPGGLEVTGQLARRPNPPAVLILTMHESEAYVVEAMRRGAAGYALKQAPSGELARGIRTVATGARYLSPPIAASTPICAGRTSSRNRRTCHRPRA